MMTEPTHHSPQPSQQPPPAGWYPEPNTFGGSRGMRYWDGTTWTGQVAPPQLFIPRATNHLLHLLLTVLTLGLWAPIWLLVGIARSSERRRALLRAKQQGMVRL